MRNLIAHALGRVLVPVLLRMLMSVMTAAISTRGELPARSRRVTQRKRRRALWWATAFGVDLDRRDIHTVLAGGAVL